MKQEINVVCKRNSITLVDDIIYSNGLGLSLLLPNLDVERKVMLEKKNNESVKHPLILCIPGGGFTHCERNRILPESMFLAEEGYVVASVDYRTSSQAIYPSQIDDVYVALEYLKNNADKYHIDIQHIGILGRSAGGFLTLVAGMNLCKNIHIDAVCSMYGITDLESWMRYELKSHYFSNVGCEENTLVGKLLGKKKDYSIDFEQFSLKSKINDNMAHILLLHGDNDPIVPMIQSENFYKEVKQRKLEELVDYYVVSGAGHGSKEFFQDEIKKLILKHFNTYLKCKMCENPKIGE